ncbi:MAG TPA: leucine-rich repeat domain-containing protein, partial [Candidatus Deferrimicrobium sp.]|nr:leucine-rich repeat domain-containing protein [Candidatus Deferrimicrobium sp.]
MSTLKDFITNVFGGEKNSPDMEIIQQIGKQTGKELKPLPFEDIWRDNGYALDKNTGQVKGLNLEGREIKYLSLLRGLSGLTHLSLRYNRVTDLTPLSALTKLTRLYLNNNQLTDLTPLSALTN